MNEFNITKTRKLDLCISCEICSASCPEGAISFEYNNGQFLPIVSNNHCKNCRLCLSICPGINIKDFDKSINKLHNHDLGGYCISSYIGYAKNAIIRKNSTSGGIITSLVKELIINNEYDYAFMLNFINFEGQPVRLKRVNQVDEIIKSSKSKYLPASIYNVIKELSTQNDNKYIIVGTPCQIKGILKFMEYKKLSREKLLFIGLFCDKTLNFNFIKYIQDHFGKKSERIIAFFYRSKIKYGWPGNLYLKFNSGREILLNKEHRIKLKDYFQLERCLYCYDKLNKLADISVGDCYIEKDIDFYGKSSILVRTNKGKEILDKNSHIFNLKKVDYEIILDSQKISEKKDNYIFSKILINKEFEGKEIIPRNIDFKNRKKLEKKKKIVSYGRNYKIGYIRYNLLISKVKDRFRYRYRVFKFVLNLSLALLRNLIFTTIFNNDLHKEKENIVIMGGELQNKGAQAMTFIIIDQLRRRYPENNLFLFSRRDCLMNKEQKEQYNFNIICWSKNNKYGVLNYPWKWMNLKNNSKMISNLVNIFNETKFIINISGYQFSSQWGLWPSFQYILDIIIAKKFCIPYYIFPQSLGPFYYNIPAKIILFPLMFIYLRYPKIIFSREIDGLNHLRLFTKKNVRKSFDIVLINDSIKKSNIYNKEPKFREIIIERNSVGIIPNTKLYNYIQRKKLLGIYKQIIENLLKSNKNVYLLRHSHEDKNIIHNIKDVFVNNSQVKLISFNLNFFELESVINQFEFIIASRYHSIISSLKNNIPVIVIGWAIKYYELLKIFNQNQYFFDIRDGLSIESINKAIINMIKNREYERKKINNCLKLIKKKNRIIDLIPN